MNRKVPLAGLWLACFLASVSAVAGPQPQLVVVLSETGEVRDGLSVLEIHPEADQVVAALGRGLSGKLLRIYRMEQTYLFNKDGAPPEPAYLLLSNREGGFPRQGFFLGDEDKSEVGYVDLKHGRAVAGRFGAMDQIFPHELAHVIQRQLAGPPDPGGANQVHAIGLRTDPVVAFNEGFAEHFQVMAVDDPDADPETRELARNPALPQRVERHFAAYQRELRASLAVATRMRMGFVAWYANDEQVLRYHAVKANGFARQPLLPERLLHSGDPYGAYLLESILPGGPHDPVKPLARMLATEGVIATLFHRWASDEALRASYRDDAFYGPFGVTGDQVTPLDNVYLKLMHAMYVHKPQRAIDLIDGYRVSFPDEAPLVDAVVNAVLLGHAPNPPPELWLANPDFSTGTTLFDQFRGVPRVHTFDLNAASEVDLVGVCGVERPLAQEIIQAAPFDSLDSLRAVPSVTDDLFEQFLLLRREMDRLKDEERVEETLSINTILMPYLWRLALCVVLATILGAAAYRLVWTDDSPASRRPGWLRTIINGLGAALTSVFFGWLPAAGLASLAAVAIVFGVPAGLWCLWKTRQIGLAFRVLAAWAAAAAPAAVLVTPWF